VTEERRETEPTASTDAAPESVGSVEPVATGVLDGAIEEVAGAPLTSEGPGATPQYWVRVHGYVSDLRSEVAYYHDFYDLRRGKLPSDPAQNLCVGDVIVFYADGPGVLYGTGTVTGDIGRPRPHPLQGRVWDIPMQKGALVKDVSKGPHVASLEPPSGLHFIRYLRDFTYIRVPAEDGPYFVEQVKIRAGGKD